MLEIKSTVSLISVTRDLLSNRPRHLTYAAIAAKLGGRVTESWLRDLATGVERDYGAAKIQALYELLSDSPLLGAEDDTH
jgi:hypothetical protein